MGELSWGLKPRQPGQPSWWNRLKAWFSKKSR